MRVHNPGDKMEFFPLQVYLHCVAVHEISQRLIGGKEDNEFDIVRLQVDSVS